jgi:hypothetical protein
LPAAAGDEPAAVGPALGAAVERVFEEDDRRGSTLSGRRGGPGARQARGPDQGQSDDNNAAESSAHKKS